MFARKTSMLNTLFLILRLTLFVDQCDGNVCTVAIAGDDEATYFTVPRASLPACAAESLDVSVAAGKCYRFQAFDDVHGAEVEVPMGGDIDLDAPAAPADHAKYCPGDWLGHMDRPADGGAQ